MAIRRAGASDISKLYDIYTQMSVQDDGYFERCLEEQDKGNRDIFIMDEIGFCILNYQPRYAFYKRLNIPEIQDLNIVPSARRKGHAQKLIAYCENLVREKGGDMVGVSVSVSAKYGPAQCLYAKLGYHPDGNGVTYNREPVLYEQLHPIDDDLCMMLVRNLPKL